VRAEVFDLVACRAEDFDDVFVERVAAVVCADGDLHVYVSSESICSELISKLRSATQRFAP
jgi:hypothetical protein